MAKTPEPPKPTTPDTLDDIIAHGPSHDAKLRGLIFRHVREDSLLARGQSIDTQDILDSAPDFWNSARGAYAALSEAKRKLILGYSPALDSIFAHDLGVLVGKHKAYLAHSSSSATARARAKKELAQAEEHAMGLRDRVARAARDYLADSSDRDALLASKGTAETWATLRDGVSNVAKVLEDLRKNPEMVALFDAVNLPASLISELRAAGAALDARGKAADAIAPETRVTKRELDVQDGTVLHLVGLIWRAFRDAHNQDETILVPKLGKMAFLFETRPRKAKEDKGEGGGGSGGGGGA